MRSPSSSRSRSKGKPDSMREKGRRGRLSNHRRLLHLEALEDRTVLSIQAVSTAVGSLIGDGPSSASSISTDGRYVAFISSATNLVTGDTNIASDVFVKNLQTGSLVRASTDSLGNQANSRSNQVSLSGDGQYVAFQSLASNLVPGDTNG